MNGLFRLPWAVPRDPAVEAWLATRTSCLGSIAEAWFRRLRSCGGDVRETLHDGCPTACVQDAAFAYVGVFRAHVSVGFFHGAELEDPAHLLLGSGKRMRHVKLRPGVPLDEGALEALIRAAYRDVERRLGGPPLQGPAAVPLKGTREGRGRGRTGG